MTNSISIVPANPNFLDAVKQLLRTEKLPVEDIPHNLNNFFLATDNGFVIGCIGLEIHGSYGLLRSLIVRPEYRNMRIAKELINALEQQVASIGLHSIYLLTETAKQYFEMKGYLIIDRNNTPEPIRLSSEFNHVCPTSATVMVKKIN